MNASFQELIDACGSKTNACTGSGPSIPRYLLPTLIWRYEDWSGRQLLTYRQHLALEEFVADDRNALIDGIGIEDVLINLGGELREEDSEFAAARSAPVEKKEAPKKSARELFLEEALRLQKEDEGDLEERHLGEIAARDEELEAARRQFAQQQRRHQRDAKSAQRREDVLQECLAELDRQSGELEKKKEELRKQLDKVRDDLRKQKEAYELLDEAYDEEVKCRRKLEREADQHLASKGEWEQERGNLLDTISGLGEEKTSLQEDKRWLQEENRLLQQEVEENGDLREYIVELEDDIQQLRSPRFCLAEELAEAEELAAAIEQPEQVAEAEEPPLQLIVAPQEPKSSAVKILVGLAGVKKGIKKSIGAWLPFGGSPAIQEAVITVTVAAAAATAAVLVSRMVSNGNGIDNGNATRTFQEYNGGPDWEMSMLFRQEALSHGAKIFRPT